jgi:phenylalanyl-tRNA synthetase beta chain
MKISLNWISDYVNLDGVNPKELALKLTMSTAEVEEVIEMGKEVDQVVVGKVIKVEPHPSSKKLKIVQVDTGGETIQSVCGAPNVKEGILAPFAKPGGRILKIPEVKDTMLSGIESRGILCSGAEIGVNNSSDQLLILDPTLEPGADLKEIYRIEDIVIEIDNKSLTHRPDLWGHYGIAREVAAILKRPLAPVPQTALPYDKNLPDLNIRIDDATKCFRYSCISVENVIENETPLDMQMRLFYCGQNPISLLVDLSNYVMMDIGQPNHAFDHDYAKSIVVKFPPEPIKGFRTLDCVARDISEDVLMIYDEDNPVALAGIMGGEESEITEQTTSLFLESANFEAYTIRKGASSLGMRTDASSRFEKSLDPDLTNMAIQRFIYLLKQSQPHVNITSNLSDLYVKKPEPITIEFDKPYLDRLIGKDLDSETVIDILERLEFKVEHRDGNFTVHVPQFRATRDIEIKADIVEEITRIYGYDNIEPQTVEVPLAPLAYNEERLLDHKVKEILSEKFGFNETHSYTWYDNDFNKRLNIEHPAEIKLLNPQAQEMNLMRASIVPTMLQFAERNVNTFRSIPLFEIGKVFYLDKNTKECDERKNLCIMLADKDLSEDELFYRLKGILSYLVKLVRGIELEYQPLPASLANPWLHPEKSTEVRLGDNPFGYLSVLHPNVRQHIDKKLKLAVLEVNFSHIFETSAKPVLYKEISKYPEVTLDFSFLAGKTTPFKDVDSHVAAFKSPLLRGYKYVLMYEGKNLPEGKKSLTFAFTLGSSEKTLLNEDINQFLNQLIKHMETKGYVLRQG